MQLPEVDRLRLTSVVDNYLDPLLRDEGPAKRRPRGPVAYERCLCSEHGLAEIVESAEGTKTFSLLFDFAASPLVYLHNLNLLTEDYRIDLKQIGTLVLSHGHWDHFGGCAAFSRRSVMSSATRRSCMPGRMRFCIACASRPAALGRISGRWMRRSLPESAWKS